MPVGMGRGPARFQMPDRVKSASDYGVDGGVNQESLDASRIGRWDENLSFENNPALQAAQDYFDRVTSRNVDNEAAAMGLARSGAALDAKRNAEAGAMVPVIQQIMGLESQNKSQDISQRGQDLQGLLQGGQNMLQARGQDLSQRGQDISGGLQARGQDISSLLQQGQQALSARGQNLSGQQASMQGLLGVDQNNLQRMLATINAASGLGGTERSIADANSAAAHDEQMRQFGLANNLLMAPFGQASSMVGQRTTSNGK